MLETDPAPKNKRSANKVETNRPWTDVDVQLESKLKAFREELHAEWWKDSEDFFLGPQIFLNLDQIHHLCHVAHAKSLANINDLQNNFKWSWMEDYGSRLLHVIHSVYKPQASTSDSREDGTMNDSGTTSPLPSVHPSSTTPSASSNLPKEVVKQSSRQPYAIYFIYTIYFVYAFHFVYTIYSV